jgi:hypothetical protein
MKTWLLAFAALAAIGLAGCVSYPGSPDYGAYPGGYPSGAYPNGGYPGGYPGNYPPPAGYPNGYGNGYGQSIRCESTDNHTRHCDMDTRGGVFLSRRLSDASCTQGRTWGYDSRGVWVTGGCRAEFTSGAGGYPPGYGNDPGYGGRVVRCESQDGHSRHCSAPVQRGVRLLRTLSDSACIEGRTWGWDRDGVWVDRGCRAEFSVY